MRFSLSVGNGELDKSQISQAIKLEIQLAPGKRLGCKNLSAGASPDDHFDLRATWVKDAVPGLKNLSLR